MNDIIEVFQSINAAVKVMNDVVVTIQETGLALNKFLIVLPDRCNVIRENLEELIKNPIQKET